MKRNTLTDYLKTAVVFAVTVLFTAGISSCHKNNDGGNIAVCPGTVVASWKVDGKAYQSSASVYTNVGSAWTLTLAACVSNEADRTLTFTLLPSPLAAGTYPLKFKSLHAEPWNGRAAADYLINNGENYFTDSTGVNSNGSITVSSIDTIAKVFSGSFFFNASNDAATQTVSITDGVLTNIKYQ